MSQARAQALVRAQTIEEREYERWLGGIAERKRRVARLRAELEALQRVLARFEAACHAHVGDLLIELRRLRHDIAAYERRLARLREDPTHDPTLDELADEHDPTFDPAWADGATAGGGEGTGWTAADEEFMPRRTAKTEAEIKRLYLALAKRCHPDHGRTGEERRRREDLMQRINAAFRDRNLADLQVLAREAEGADPAFADRPPRERLAWARQEVAWLDAELEELRVELVTLRRSELHRRWRRYEAGHPVLERLEDDLQSRLKTEGARRDELVAAYREAQDRHLRAASAVR